MNSSECLPFFFMIPWPAKFRKMPNVPCLSSCRCRPMCLKYWKEMSHTLGPCLNHCSRTTQKHSTWNPSLNLKSVIAGTFFWSVSVCTTLWGSSTRRFSCSWGLSPKHMTSLASVGSCTSCWEIQTWAGGCTRCAGRADTLDSGLEMLYTIFTMRFCAYFFGLGSAALSQVCATWFPSAAAGASQGIWYGHMTYK